LIPTLQFPVHTLDGRQLLPAGTRLDEAVMQEIAANSQAKRVPFQSLLGYRQIHGDLKIFLTTPPYHVIFGATGQQNFVWEQMLQVNIPVPCLKTLDYFRQYDFCTYRHILMVFALTTLLARDLAADCRDWLYGSFAGPTHDIGKICVPLEILLKTTPLTRLERRQLEHHSLAGYVLLSHYLGNHNHFAARVARDHHERKNGSGYPRGIRDIDPMIEIIMVCDIYDALVSERPYRSGGYDNRTALEEITRLAKKGEISWNLVKALIARNRQVRFDADNLLISEEKRGTPPERSTYGILLDDDQETEN